MIRRLQAPGRLSITSNIWGFLKEVVAPWHDLAMERWVQIMVIEPGKTLGESDVIRKWPGAAKSKSKSKSKSILGQGRVAKSLGSNMVSREIASGFGSV